MTREWELGIENLPKEELGIDLYLELEGGEAARLGCLVGLMGC